MQRGLLLCIDSRDWFTRIRGCYAAYRFYHEDQARHRRRVSAASPASLAGTAGGPQARGMSELLDLPARYGTFRLYGGRGFSALSGDHGYQPGQRTLGGSDERYFNPRSRGGYELPVCS